MSVTPARGPRSVEEDELLALARRLPEPILTEARREEMRTAFLSAVRQLNGDVHARPFIVTRRRRLLVIGALVLAGAAAAAAWQIRKVVPSKGPAVVSPTAGVVGPSLAKPAAASPAAVSPAVPEKVPERPPAAARPRKLALAHRSVGEREPGGEVEIAFARGWSALRTGDFSAAADAFARASTSTDNALGEDALFWQGVALDRAGRFGAARGVLSDFLVRYPRSDRQGEGAVILGWLLIRAGERDEARARFAAALDDPAERVRNSAHAGLAAVVGRPR